MTGAWIYISLLLLLLLSVKLLLLRVSYTYINYNSPEFQFNEVHVPILSRHICQLIWEIRCNNACKFFASHGKPLSIDKIQAVSSLSLSLVTGAGEAPASFQVLQDLI